MRVVVAGPPKSGNVWVKNIIATLYDLEVLTGTAIPSSADSLRATIESKTLPDRWIFHQHLSPSPDVLDLCAVNGLVIVTPIRNPYDVFVSLYYYAQDFADAYRAANDPAVVLIGKPISHPDVMHYLASGFQSYLRLGVEWLRSGRSLVVRYELLHEDPIAEVEAMAARLGSRGPEAIVAALEASTAASMRSRDKWMRKHIRSATVGDWLNHLSDGHLAVLRRSSAELIRELGYEVA